MRCKDIMKIDVEVCWVMDPAAEVAERMRTRGIGFLPVCSETGEVVGTVTDRDLTVRLLAERLPHRTPIHRIMSTTPVTCSPFDPLALAEDTMRRHHIRRIVCVDERNRPLGIISLADIADVEFGWPLLREGGLRDVQRYAMD
ncbi:MAG: CBS domain-containing protein [Labilithrix sp.]|nr:CBS domain-containing protein [Labilithrix sp.]